MQNTTFVLTSTEIILATIGIIILSCSGGIILFEMFQNKQKPGYEHFERKRYAKKVFRIGLGISFSLIALNFIVDAISIYYKLSMLWVLCFVILAVCGLVCSIILSAYFSSKWV